MPVAEYGINLEKVKKDILKKYNYKIKPIAQVAEEEKQILSISPLFDLQLNGGIPEGSNVLLSGPPKCGKSTLALQIALGAQELDGRPVFYFDVEGRFKKMNLHTVRGLDPNYVQHIRSEEGNLLSGEDHLNIAWDVIQTVPRAVILLDSTSQICSSNEISEPIKGSTRHSGPKLMGDFTRKLSTAVAVQNTIVVMIQHVIADTGRSMKTKSVSGGNKIQYQGDVNIECSHFQDWMNGDDLIGKISHWKVVTSALGGPTGSFPANIRYGVGLDKTNEIIDLSQDMGLISKAGAWYSLTSLQDNVGIDKEMTDFVIKNDVDIDKVMTDKKEKEKLGKLFKYQGIAKTRDFLESHPYMLKVLSKQIKEIIQ